MSKTSNSTEQASIIDISQNLQEAYFHASFFRPERLAEIKQEIREASANALQCFSHLDEQINAAKKLIKQAENLKKAGIARDSIELNELKEKMKNTLSSNFINLLYQAYDNFASSNETVKTNEAGDFQAFPEVPAFLLSYNYLLESYLIRGFWDEKNRVDAQRVAKANLLNAVQEQYKQDTEEFLKDLEPWFRWARKIIKEYEKCLTQKNDQVNHNKKTSLEKTAKASYYVLANHLRRCVKKVNKFSKRIDTFKNYTPKIDKATQLGSLDTAFDQIDPEEITNKIVDDKLHSNSLFHQNDIINLQAADSWTLLIDESGSEFDSRQLSKKSSSIIAGVLFDDSQPLPEIKPGLHVSTDFSKNSLQRADQAISDMLKYPCGVLALSVNSLRFSSGWLEAVAAFVDLVLRIIPVHKNKTTKLKVLIENRGIYSEDLDLIRIRDTCRYVLMQTLPERAKKIDFDFAIMAKNHPHNSYPDIVANSCLARNPISKERLKQSDWKGSCFLDNSVKDLRTVLESFYLREEISAEVLQELLAQDNANRTNKHNLFKALLDSFGLEAQFNANIWQKYLNYTMQHLDSKAINISTLYRQVNWLALFQPANFELPAKLKLTWLTTKLAEANHRGIVSDKSEAEFEELSENLFEEDAPLVCWAALHRAVQLSNSFQFKEAEMLVEKWKSIPAAVPGLAYYGRMLSTFGQHQAFQDNLKEAEIFFRKAIRAFSRLSNKTDAAHDINQTQAYLLNVLMDMPDTPEEILEIEMSKYFAMPLQAAAKELASDNSDAKKYQQHILLRFLANNPQNPAVKIYLQEQDNWQTAAGHPWQLIILYRALLLQDDKQQCLALLKDSLQSVQASNPGLTLKFIETVITAIAFLYDSTYKNKVEELIKELEPKLTNISSNFEVLKDHLKNPMKAEELLKSTLPFNFR